MSLIFAQVSQKLHTLSRIGHFMLFECIHFITVWIFGYMFGLPTSEWIIHDSVNPLTLWKKWREHVWNMTRNLLKFSDGGDDLVPPCPPYHGKPCCLSQTRVNVWCEKCIHETSSIIHNMHTCMMCMMGDVSLSIQYNFVISCVCIPCY